MKKILSLALALALMMAFMAGCGSEPQSNSKESGQNQESQHQENSESPETAGSGENETGDNDDQTTGGNENEANGGFTLEYPADMQKLGYTEPVMLEQLPERVVSLSAAPVLALYELGVNLVGVPSSRVVAWPEDLAANAATVSFSIMSPEDFDYEAVVALEPDLVLLAASGADTAGAKLESLGIPVYYLYAGHTVSYDSIKMQTQALIDAFGIDGEAQAAGEAILNRFSTLENSLEDARSTFGGKTVMVLQSGSAEMHYIQTKDGTLGSMLDMLGFENVYTNDASSMVQLDYEQALDYDPDYVVCVGGTDAETHRGVMEEAFQTNPAYWNAIPAVERGDVIYVDVTYCSTAGINVIDNITNLIGVMSDAIGTAA